MRGVCAVILGTRSATWSSSLLVPLGVRKLDLFAGDLGDAIDLEAARWAGWYDYDRPQDFLGGETLAEFYQH
jgi:hypothetical protein